MLRTVIATVRRYGACKRRLAACDARIRTAAPKPRHRAAVASK